MEKEPRRRLKKLKPEPPPQSTHGLIPKKKNLPHHEKSNNPLEEDDDSLEDFIVDRVEYDRKGPPTSSEESAHSTDEENFLRKKKKVKQSSSESNNSSSGSDMSNPDNNLGSEAEKGSPKEILVGKKALEAKRQQGLIKDKHSKHEKHSEKSSKHEKHSKHEKSEKKVKKKVKRQDEETEKKRTSESGSRKSVKDQKKYIQFSEFNEKERKKAEIVTKVLQRWWYAFDEWPPQDFDYSKGLREKKLRLVNKENWSVEPVVNDEGFEKVIGLPGYTGLFVNHSGNVIDLRPAHSCPSFDNLFAKGYQEVREILVKALSNQIEQLKIQPRFDKELLKGLTKELAYYQKQI